jgi:hypothetical protein
MSEPQKGEKREGKGVEESDRRVEGRVERA